MFRCSTTSRLIAQHFWILICLDCTLFLLRVAKCKHAQSAQRSLLVCLAGSELLGGGMIGFVLFAFFAFVRSGSCCASIERNALSKCNAFPQALQCFPKFSIHLWYIYLRYIFLGGDVILGEGNVQNIKIIAILLLGIYLTRYTSVSNTQRILYFLNAGISRISNMPFPCKDLSTSFGSLSYH